MYLRNKLAIRGLYNLLSRNSDADVTERSFLAVSSGRSTKTEHIKEKEKLGKLWHETQINKEI